MGLHNQSIAFFTSPLPLVWQYLKLRSSLSPPPIRLPTGDVIPPVISNCPMSVYIRAGGQPSQSVTWTIPEATDNSGSASLIYSSHQPNTLFNVGVTPVTYIFADPNQNYARCTFIVTVAGKPFFSIPSCFALVLTQPAQMAFSFSAACMM